MGLEADVLARIRPGAAEDARLADVIRDLTSKVVEALEAKAWPAKPLLVGSVAKGTHLTGTEIDLFVAFPPDLPRKDLEERGLALGELLERGVHMYAEHPYTRGWYGGFEVEIVPCYRIVDAKGKISAVDRTPLHADYVIGRLQEGQADEVRLLKAWTEGIGAYGAEAKVQGFSGYLCELLVIKYGTFRRVLEASLAWRRGETIELDAAAAHPFEDPLVMIDPIDAGRNVASAVSVERLAEFVHAAGEYLRAPSDRYFFPRPLRPRGVTSLRSAVTRYRLGLLAVAVRAPAVTEDVLYPQIRKAHRALLELFARHGFVVHDARFDVAGKDAVFLFVFSVDRLPRVMRHEGPPVWVRNAKEFLDKWSRNPKAVGGPFIVGERWAVDVVRGATDPARLVKAMRQELRLGRDLDRSARRSLRIVSGASAIRAGTAEAWTRLFDKRFPWER